MKESREPRLLPKALWSAAKEVQHRSRYSARGKLNATVKVRYYMRTTEGWEKRGWKGAFEIGDGVGVLYNISWNIQDAEYKTEIRYMSSGGYMKKGDIVELGQVRIVLREDGHQPWEDARVSRDNEGDEGRASRSCAN